MPLRGRTHRDRLARRTLHGLSLLLLLLLLLLPTTRSDLPRCYMGLLAKLETMKTAGVLRHSLAPRDTNSEFEILEFYGDSVL